MIPILVVIRQATKVLNSKRVDLDWTLEGILDNEGGKTLEQVVQKSCEC